MAMTVKQLLNIMYRLDQNGFGDDPIMIEESGDGYYGDLHHVDTVSKCVVLIGTQSGSESV